jgi:hypothetical protein
MDARHAKPPWLLSAYGLVVSHGMACGRLWEAVDVPPYRKKSVDCSWRAGKDSLTWTRGGRVRKRGQGWQTSRKASTYGIAGNVADAVRMYLGNKPILTISNHARRSRIRRKPMPRRTFGYSTTSHVTGKRRNKTSRRSPYDAERVTYGGNGRCGETDLPGAALRTDPLQLCLAPRQSTPAVTRS